MTRPNFLIIQADQLTSQVLYAYGRPLAKTPHVDELAARGMVFRNAYCSYPLCGPSRMSMMTGRLASRIGAFDNAAQLSSEIPTFAHYLRAQGYRTTLSGKMHFVGPDQLHGFEERLTTDIYPGDFYWTENLESRDEKHKSDDRGVTMCGICDRSVQLDYDELTMFHAEQHLWDIARQKVDRPFCLFVSLTHPHDPYFCTQEYYDRYTDDEVPLPTVGRVPSQAADPLSRFITERHVLDQDFDPAIIRKARRAYLGSCSYIDDQVGRLMTTLSQARLRDNTVVILLGDHGEMLGERGMWFKRHFFEWSARVPMIFSGGNVPAGTRDENVTLTDLAPTLLALADESGSNAFIEPLEGRDLTPLMSGNSDGFDNVAAAEVMSDGLSAPIFMLRRDDWKIIWGPEHPPQLFDLEADPEEQEDLANDPTHAARREALIAEVHGIWDAEELQSQINLSIARRLLIRTAHDVGQAPRWDFVASPEDDRWCRTGADYSAWALDVLNPR
ncbi:MAG: choline-sulfatase [Pseudomonadota bacterium]